MTKTILQNIYQQVHMKYPVAQLESAHCCNQNVAGESHIAFHIYIKCKLHINSYI